MAGTRNTAGHQDIGDSKETCTGTAGTWRSTGHQDSGVASRGPWGQVGVHTRPQGEVGAGGGGGLAQPLEVAQVLEDEDEGGPAEDDAAEGAALQQPRQEGPQALGQPRAPRHVPRPGGHRPGLSPACGVFAEPVGDKGWASHHAGTHGGHGAAWSAQGARASMWPPGQRPLSLATAAGTGVPPCARAQDRALQRPGLAHVGTAGHGWHTPVYRRTHGFTGACVSLQVHTQVCGSHTHLWVQIHTFTGTHTHLWAHTYTHLWAHTPAHRHTHTCSHAHTQLYRHAHLHARPCLLTPVLRPSPTCTRPGPPGVTVTFTAAAEFERQQRGWDAPPHPH